MIANIRGGGEYGPKWHQAALKEKRHKAYEDVEVGGGVASCSGLGVSHFTHWRQCLLGVGQQCLQSDNDALIPASSTPSTASLSARQAVAADIIARKISSPPKLAVIGGSNGGLMVGNMITRPVASVGWEAGRCFALILLPLVVTIT